jgi:4,5-DOPA dioxygenase extradiol
MSLPTLFISHGSPMLLVEDTAARDFLSGYASTLPKPRGIVIASAHFGTSRPAVVVDAQPGMIYDFGGMPQLRRLVYRAPGDPVAAIKVAGLLEAAGFAPAVVKDHGYDHGTWVPLMLLYPQADVPVLQLSVQPHLGPAHHVAVGRALATLKDEGFLVIGSGSATHNLAEFYSGAHAPDQPALRWVADFTSWMHDKIADGRIDDLVRYRALAPHAAENHPTEEHLLPLFIALGAAGDAVHGKRVHASTRNGVLAMDTYAFG